VAGLEECLIAVVSMFSFAATATVTELLCRVSKNTVEDTKCISAEIDKADTTLRE
jgi:hypothetical protein